MHETPFFEPEEEIECPACGEGVPIQADYCPHCDVALL